MIVAAAARVRMRVRDMVVLRVRAKERVAIPVSRSFRRKVQVAGEDHDRPQVHRRMRAAKTQPASFRPL